MLGSRGNDVVQLQTFLITRGDLAGGNNTGYFGKLTQTAVQSWQRSRNIVLSGTPATTGFGAVGPKTRAAMAACVATSALPTNPPPSGSIDQSTAIQALQNQINELNKKLANQTSNPPQTTVTTNTTAPASNTPSTGATSAPQSANSQAASSQTTNVVNDCGVKSDDATDNRAAIQQCIDAHAANGATLFFPTGSYRVNGTLKISHGGITIQGASQSNTHLVETDPAATLIDISNGGAVVNLTNIHDLNLIYATLRASGTLITTNNAWRTYIKNVVFGSTAESFRMGAQGISAIGGNGLFVDASTFATPMGRGIYASKDIGDIYLTNLEINMDYPSTVSAVGLVFDDNANGIYATNINITAGDIGVEFIKSGQASPPPSFGFFTNVLTDRQRVHGWYFQEAKSVTLSNSWASSADSQGIIADDIDGLSITGSRIYNNGDAGIWLTANSRNTQITNSRISGNSRTTSGATSGVVVAPGAIGITMQGNVIGPVDSFPNRQAYGIAILAGTTDNILITGNNLSNNISGGLLNQATGANQSISNNLGQ